MKKNNSRLIYFIIFILLFAIETVIAVFVHDSYVRPFVGDVLVVMLVCAFLRIFVPEKNYIPLLATAFAITVEILQYFDFVKLLGLENSVILSTALGRAFDIKDIICYITGGAIFRIAETYLRRKTDEP